MTVFLAPKLAKILHSLIAAGSFPALWRTANITQIPKSSSPSQISLDYRTILITLIISKVYEKFIFHRLYKFLDSIKVLFNIQFGFRKDIATTSALLLLSHDLQFSLDKRGKSRIISLDFGSAFDLINQ